MSNGKVVLARRAIEPARGYWTFPSGYVELGESAREAAIRETWEEVGLHVRIKSLLGVYSYADAGVVTVVYLARVLKGPCQSLGSESLEVRFFSPQDVPWDRLAFRSTRDALESWCVLYKKACLEK